jgi:hypothetical protein
MDGILYYSDNTFEGPIFQEVQDILSGTGLPIVSVTLKPLKFGQNIVMDLPRCYPTMVKQIIAGLESLRVQNVFFTEHDVLYSPSHFSFVPPRHDIFYYDTNVWRWDYPKERYFTYDRLLCLSMMCCDRKLALEHYKKRLEIIQDNGWDFPTKGEPAWQRRMGYEPGTKKKKRGGFTDDDFETWAAPHPSIDVRHKGTFSPPKVNLQDFKWEPTGWQETTIKPI